MIEALAELGVEYDGISQTEQYTSGAYREQILHAMRHRGDIDAILDQYRTKKAPAKKQPQKPVDEAELEAAEGSGAAAEDDGSGGAAGYFPYKPYCGSCEKDLTTVTAVRRRDHRADLHLHRLRLRRDRPAERVQPRQAGLEGRLADALGVRGRDLRAVAASTTPRPARRSSVGGQIVREIFGGEQPIGPMYAFVGISGMAKMSSLARAACRPRPTR